MFLDLGKDKFWLRDCGSGDAILTATYEEAEIDTSKEGDWEQYDKYIEKVLGYLPEYEIG